MVEFDVENIEKFGVLHFLRLYLRSSTSSLMTWGAPLNAFKVLSSQDRSQYAKTIVLLGQGHISKGHNVLTVNRYGNVIYNIGVVHHESKRDHNALVFQN